MPLPPLNQPPSGPKKPFNWGRFSKTLSFWALIILIPVAFFRLAQGRDQQAPTISYSLYDQQLARDNIKKVTIASGQQMVGEYEVRDTGRGIKGQEIDIYIAGDGEAKRFGRRRVKVEILERKRRR